MHDLLFYADVPLVLTSVFVLIAVFIDMLHASPYRLVGIKISYPQAPKAEQNVKFCFVLATIVFCDVLVSYFLVLEDYMITLVCWLLTGAGIYISAKMLASALVIIFRRGDFVNGKA